MIYFANFQQFTLCETYFLAQPNKMKPRVLYMCCAASRELRGLMEWSIQRNPSSRRVTHVFYTKDDMLYSRWTCHGLWCRHVLPYVCILHVEYARQGYTPFKRRVSEVGCCLCSGLTHGYSFYSERVMYMDASVTCWHGRFFSAGTLTTFRKSTSANRVAPTSYCKESWL
jgi:hypothetical protein